MDYALHYVAHYNGQALTPSRITFSFRLVDASAMTLSEYDSRLRQLRKVYWNLLADASFVTPIPGWLHLLDGLCSRLSVIIPSEHLEAYRTTRIGEKNGGLTATFSGSTLKASRKTAVSSDRMHVASSWAAKVQSVVENIEAKSKTTCIFCGTPFASAAGPKRRLPTCTAHKRLSYAHLALDFEGTSCKCPTLRAPAEIARAVIRHQSGLVSLGLTEIGFYDEVDGPAIYRVVSRDPAPLVLNALYQIEDAICWPLKVSTREYGSTDITWALTRTSSAR